MSLFPSRDVKSRKKNRKGKKTLRNVLTGFVVQMRVPIYDRNIRHCSEFRGDGFKSACDGRVRLHDAVVPHDADSERLLGVDVVGSPWDGEESGFVKPGLGGEDGLHEEFEAVDGGA